MAFDCGVFVSFFFYVLLKKTLIWNNSLAKNKLSKIRCSFKYKLWQILKNKIAHEVDSFTYFSLISL